MIWLVAASCFLMGFAIRGLLQNYWDRNGN